MTNYCVCCGDELPEGSLVCPNCIRFAEVSLEVPEPSNEIQLCRRCGRKLRTAAAKERGYGRICWEKSRTSKNKRPLFSVNKGDDLNGSNRENS